MPLFDAAYFTVRARDVGTPHNPLVGAWSMGSREVGTWLNNLGPLQLDALAAFTKVDPYWGTAAGVAATNVAAIVGVWSVSRRLLGPVGVVGAMAATVVLQLNEGSLMLIEARQQLALVLPMWCTLWLAVATWMGRRWALPWLALAASFVLQTHFTYAYQTMIVAGAATIAFVVHHRAQFGERRPDDADHRRGSGHLSGPNRYGTSRSARATRATCSASREDRSAPSACRAAYGSLPSRRSFPRSSHPARWATCCATDRGRRWPVAVFALSMWAAALVGVASVMVRHHRALAAMAAIGATALAGSIVAAIKIPPTEQFGIIAQNYYWSWPIAVFAATAITGSILRRPYRRLVERSGPPSSEVVVLALAAATVLAAVPLLRPTNLLPETDHEWAVSRQLARPLLDDLRASIDELGVAGPVLIDLGAVRHVRYTLLAELQRRDIDFVFPAGSTDLSRFGDERCDDGTAPYLLTLRGGSDAVQLRGADTLLAAVPGLTGADSARSAELAYRFGAALRDGSITVDKDTVIEFGGEVPSALGQIIDTPEMPARRLSEFLANWSRFGAVEVPMELRPDLDEWRDLERRAGEDRMAIYLRPIPADRPDLCHQIEPGEDFLDVAT